MFFLCRRDNLKFNFIFIGQNKKVNTAYKARSILQILQLKKSIS